jgi:hypothetical protein
MPKKLLSILLSCTVFLYGLGGCSRYNEKVGLNVNLEPSIPIVGDVTGNQNSNSNSDLPKPAVDTADDSDSSPNPEPSKPVVDLANDKSSDAKPEPSKAVVEKKEEAKENKAEVVVEKDKPTEVGAKSKSDKDKPDEEKKPDPAPVNPLNNNGIPQAAGLAIGVAVVVGGIIAIAHAIYNRFFRGADNPPADPEVNDDNDDLHRRGNNLPKEKKDPPDVNDGNEEEDDGMGEVPQGSGQIGVLKANVSPQQTQTKEKKEKKEKRQGQQEAQLDQDQPNPQPEVATDLQAQPEAEAAVVEVAAQPADVVDLPDAEANRVRNGEGDPQQARPDQVQQDEPQQRPVIPRVPRPVQQHVGDNLTPLQIAENELFELYEYGDLLDFDRGDRREGLEEMREIIDGIRNGIRRLEDRILKLQEQQPANQEQLIAQVIARNAARQAEVARRAAQNPPPAPTPEEIRRADIERRGRGWLAQRRLAEERAEERAAARARLIDQLEANLVLLGFDPGTVREARLAREARARAERRLRNRRRAQHQEVDGAEVPPVDEIAPCAKGNGG